MTYNNKPVWFIQYRFLLQLLVDKITQDLIQTADLWWQKRPLYHLRHNHCPSFPHLVFYKTSIVMQKKGYMYCVYFKTVVNVINFFGGNLDCSKK